jgi:hypothetical protein
MRTKHVAYNSNFFCFSGSMLPMMLSFSCFPSVDMFFDCCDTFGFEKDDLCVDNVEKDDWEALDSFLCVEQLFFDPPKQSRV